MCVTFVCKGDEQGVVETWKNSETQILPYSNKKQMIKTLSKMNRLLSALIL